MTFTKSLVAAAAVATTLGLGAAAPEASAKTTVDVHIGVGGYYPGYGYYAPANYRYRGISCYRGEQIVRGHGFHSIRPVNCAGAVYAFKARKGDRQFLVRVHVSGAYLGARRTY